MGKIVLFTLGIILAILLLPGETLSYHQYSSDNDSKEQSMFRKLNDYRRANGVPELIWDDALHTFSRLRVSDMAKRGYFSHYIPPKKDFSASKFMFMAGIDSCGSSAENIAWNIGSFDPADRAFNDFKNSPGHNAIMLDPRLKRVGIGAVANDYSQAFLFISGRWFFAQVFSICE